MAARKRRKTVLLKSDLEEIIAKMQAKLAETLVETDLLIDRVSPGRDVYYYGRRGAITELSDFLSLTKSEYLD